MNPAGTARLRDEQIIAIDETVQKLDKLQKYVDDYVMLGDRLRTLPDQVKHDVMVPFGKFAYMPGQLIHTNEILVLLGDDWFCERSAKQAAEIATRRAQNVMKTMEDLEKQKALLQPRLDYTTELQEMQDTSGAFEIQEDFDIESEKLWKEQHREKVRAHKQKVRVQREQKLAEASETKATVSDRVSPSDEDIWRRLDELEYQERRNREMSRLDEESDVPVANVLPKQLPHNEEDFKKHVKWEDEANDTSDVSEGSLSTDSDCGGSGDDDSCDNVISRPSTIMFTHTQTSVDTMDNADLSNTGQEAAPLVQSPADIYVQFVEPTAHTPKSILKPSSERFLDRPDLQQKPKHSHHVVSLSESTPGEPEAFTGAVLEKTPEINPETLALKCDISALREEMLHPPEGATDHTSAQNTTKKVSRFKARQMKGS